METQVQNIKDLMAKIQEHNPNLDIENATPCFTDPLEPLKDLTIHSLHFTFIKERQICIWTIICSGSDARNYANNLAEDEPLNSVLIQDLEGTINGSELFNITVIAG